MKRVSQAQHRNKTTEVKKCTQNFDRLHQNLNTRSNLTYSHFDLTVLLFSVKETHQLIATNLVFLQNLSKQVTVAALSVTILWLFLKFYHFYIVVSYYNTM